MFQKRGCTDTIIHVVWRQNHISTCEKEYWNSPPDGEELGRDLWPATAHVSRVQAHLSDMVSVKQPAQEPFKPEAKPSMLASSKLPLVGVPVVGGRVQPLLLIGGQQLVPVVHALLHVESLDVRGEAVQRDRLPDLVSHEPFRSLRNVLSNLVEAAIVFLVVIILQPLDCL